MNSVRVLICLVGALLVASCGRREDLSTDVALKDGGTLHVELLAKYGPDIVVQGTRERIDLRFRKNGRDYHWRRERLRGEDWISGPVIVDFLGDEPVVVFPVSRSPGCREYGFPPEGLVAQRFNGHDWVSMSVSSLPADMSSNLPGPMNSSGPPRQISIGELVAFHRTYDESCEEMHPNATTLDALKALVKATAAATVLKPKHLSWRELTSVDRDALMSAPKSIESNRNISVTCENLIDDVDAFRILGGGVVNEIRWVARNGSRNHVQVPQDSTSVFCDAESVYALTNNSNGDISTVYRFSRDADFRDVLKLSTKEMWAEHLPAPIGAVMRSGDRLLILWSPVTQCAGIDDENCRPFSVIWPNGSDSPASP